MTFRALIGSFLLCFFVSFPVLAADIFGIVSDRAAAEVAAAAEQIDGSSKIILRTPSQLADLPDDRIYELLKSADTILIAGVFADQAPRLLQLIGNSRAKASIYAFNSDQRLIFASRDRDGAIFSEEMRSRYQSLIANPENLNLDDFLKKQKRLYPRLANWLTTRAYWTGRGTANLTNLFHFLLAQSGEGKTPPPPAARPDVQLFMNGKMVPGFGQLPTSNKPLVVLLDLDTGARAGMNIVHHHLTREFEEQGFATLSVFSRWGEATYNAIKDIGALPNLAGFVSFQDFVMGGGSHREQVTSLLEEIDLPVIHTIRLTDLTKQEWLASPEGLPWRSIHYRLAMPEVQGVSQPLVVACAGEDQIHPKTGLKVTHLEPVKEQMQRVVRRVYRWRQLKTKPNAEKRLAIVYYNHPPGRHNIGADNLDVIESLWDMLNRLKQEGYQTGPLPATPNELLEQLQNIAVNLPENAQALKHQAETGISINPEQYGIWYADLPSSLRSEMEQGPLGYLHQRLLQCYQTEQVDAGKRLLETTLEDLDHILIAVDTEAGRRARNLMDQLKTLYLECLDGKAPFKEALRYVQAIVDLRIEGIRGWGIAPGRVMVHENKMLVPGIEFGNIFVGPQPPRGWEIDEELLHANLAFPPTHQYIGFYFWINKSFQADALIHLGRHSTYEFLPRRRAGLAEDDYSWQISGELPGIYPYIVDGVGEGIQAKRRGLAVIVDHLTPPLRTTPLYDSLLKLRDLVESYESSHGGDNSGLQESAVRRIRKLVAELNMRDELEAELRHELHDESIVLDKIDDELLVHEVGHYLTELQEQFMPIGLHVFGRDWSDDAVEMMLSSMNVDAENLEQTRKNLRESPKSEMTSFLHALNGGFVAPGEGNDPIRTPSALPTGRNFHALSGDVLPTRVAYDLAVDLAKNAVEGQTHGSHGVVLWASDTVRDQGVMVAFALALMGMEPVWNSRGIVKGVIPSKSLNIRHDVVATTSGLFRDLYGNLLALIDEAALVALAASGQTIIDQYPDYEQALLAALERIESKQSPGSQSLSVNHLAASWLANVREAVAHGMDPATAGVNASMRIFGDAPGAYGAGINRLTERSGAWRERRELAQAYTTRMGHGYGVKATGASMHEVFRNKLEDIRFTYLGRSSNLYGLIDNNDGFDYLGGLSLAVEIESGKVPMNRVLSYADTANTSVEPLTRALLTELRGRYLNPEWIKPLMEHGYSGARTMSSKFLENLWGWQVTNPDVVRGWVWDDVKKVYFDDAHQLGLDEFLDQPENAPVKANMIAIFLVAAEKQFWNPDPSVLKALAEEFIDIVAEHGLPGSGHTTPDHRVMDMIAEIVDESRADELERVLEQTRINQEMVSEAIAHASEISPVANSSSPSLWIALVIVLCMTVLIGGIRKGLAR